MDHHFNIDFASRYGIEEAIVADNLFFWIAKNATEGDCMKGGRFWVASSVKAISTYFPYMSEAKVTRTLKSLITQGMLLKDCFNGDGMDRKCWYAFSDEGVSIMENYGYRFLAFNSPEIKCVSTTEETEANVNLNVNDMHTEDAEELVLENPESDESEPICDDIPIIEEQAESLYLSYPSKCPVRGMSLDKRPKDKRKIESLIRKIGYNAVKFAFDKEVSDKYGKSYMRNLATFLNNFPEHVCKDSELLFPEPDDVDYDKVRELFNGICKSFSPLKFITETRKRLMRMRFAEMGSDYGVMEDVFRKMEDSKFLKGSNGKWKADFDWLFGNDSRWAKISEGSYGECKDSGKTVFDVNGLWKD